MADIYSKAGRTIAWLGEADVSIYCVLYLPYLVTQRQPQTAIAARYLKGSLEFKLDMFSNQEWNAVSQLFSRPYWTRLWIAQELVKNTNIVIRCGAFTFDYRVLAGGFRWISRHDKTPPFPTETKLVIIQVKPFRYSTPHPVT